MAALSAVALGALLAWGPAGMAAGEDGKAVFTAQGCDMCHAVSTAGIEAKTKSEKMMGPDLGTGELPDASTFAAWLKRESEKDGKKHMKPFKGSDADIATLHAWLASLR
jgi:hypothetical protein